MLRGLNVHLEIKKNYVSMLKVYPDQFINLSSNIDILKTYKGGDIQFTSRNTTKHRIFIIVINDIS